MSTVSKLTIININNTNSCRSSYFGCRSTFSPGCFDFGFNNYNNFSYGFGTGLGFAAGNFLLPVIPKILNGIGKVCSFAWNKGIVPAANWIGKGISNCWNKIFHKNKNKTEKS